MPGFADRIAEEIEPRFDGCRSPEEERVEASNMPLFHFTSNYDRELLKGFAEPTGS
jgi:hypothetical protein